MATIEKNNADAIVDAYVKQNGNNEITGDIMNTVLKTLIGYALRGLHFLGVVDSNTSFPTNTPFFGLAIGADTIEGVTIPANALACVYNNGETGDTNQVVIILSTDALIAAHNTSNTAHSDIRTDIADGLDNLQDQIDALSASSDVTDVVGTYTDLENYDTSGLTENDILKVLEDSTHDDSTTYYRWILVGGVGQWQYIGEQGAYYTKAEADAKFVEQVSGKGLSSNDFTDSFKTAVENLYNLLRITGSADNGTYLTTLDNIKGIIGIGNRVNSSYLEFLQAVTQLDSAVPIDIQTSSTTSANTGITITAAMNIAKAILAMADGQMELTVKDDQDATKAYIGMFALANAVMTFVNGLNMSDGGNGQTLAQSFGSIQIDATTGDIEITTIYGKKLKYNGTEVATVANMLANLVDGSATGSVRSINANSTIGQNSFAFGNGAIASGDNSQAFGYATASNAYAHAEGASTTASAQASHAEGSDTTASGNKSHAEGFYSTASGESSHAEGRNTNATGKSSHSEGTNTIANHKSQHVFGEYNVADTNVAAETARGDYVEIVGNGTANNARSNARTLDWNGNEVLSGNLKINGTQDVAVVNPITSTTTTLVANKWNDLSSGVDFASIALPLTVGNEEYNGVFESTTSGTMTTTGVTWYGDTAITAGNSYSFSIQAGIGFIIEL